MRTFTTTHTVYTFDELSDEAKQNALENLSDINVDYDWWDSTYEDAKTIGLEIADFDLRGEIHGNLIDGMTTVFDKINGEHGESTDTYQLAKSYEAKHDALVAKYSDGKQLDRVAEGNEDEYDEEADELEENFSNDLLDEYFKLLQSEYEYATSEEAIKDTIEANDYEFTEEGDLA